MDLEYVSLDDPVLEKIRQQNFKEFIKDYGTSEFILTSLGTLGIGSAIYYYFYKHRVRYYERRKVLDPILKKN